MNDELKYTWLHIPSGEKGYRAFSDHYYFKGVTRYLTRAAKLEAINVWNSKQPGIWQYWL